MNKIGKELLEIKGKRDAISPDDVITYAKKRKASECYKHFDRQGLWDDKTAANIARYDAARHLIHRFRIKIIGNDNQSRPMRAMVSLTADRYKGAPSYRLRTEILSEANRLHQMKNDAAMLLSSVLTRFADVLDNRQLDILKTIIGELRPLEEEASGGESSLLIAAATA